MPTLDEVRRIALALPEATESGHFGAPSFRVDKKIFAVLREERRVTLKLDPEDQHNLVAGHPGVVAPVTGPGRRSESAGRQGWTFLRYDLADEALVANLLRLAWSGVAPKRLPTRS